MSHLGKWLLLHFANKFQQKTNNGNYFFNPYFLLEYKNLDQFNNYVHNFLKLCQTKFLCNAIVNEHNLKRFISI